MNQAQRYFLLFYFSALLIFCLYVPITTTDPSDGHKIQSRAWIWKLNASTDASALSATPRNLALDTLVWQTILATAICGLACIIVSNKDFIISLVFIIFAMIVIGILTMLVIKLKTSV
ncbi:MAG: hypothetical protein OEM52_10865 [bacterium]|nr:hypothetical protein [bacterium]